jgi:hypothetical protein
MKRKKLNPIFGDIIEIARECECCKLCAYSYIRDEAEMGYCKKIENAQGIMPKMVHEMFWCQYFEKK